MPLRNRVLLALLLVAAVLAIVFAPAIMANGLRTWIWWKARQQKLKVEIDKIEASLFKPLVLRGLHITTAPDAPVRLDVRVPQATLQLDLKVVLLRMRGRAIHALSLENLQVETHRNHAGPTLSEKGWSTLQRLLPDNFNFERCNVRIEDGPSVFLLRNASLSGNQVEAARFSAGEMMVTSPSFRQTFSDLRGSTKWQGDRLTIAGLSLTRGLDVQWIVGDLSRLGKQRIGLECDLDVFGGKIRLNVTNDWKSQHVNWNMVGSAFDISLAQTSEAIGFTDRVDGLLHGCKFTYRGDPRSRMRATASLWMELTGLTWRGRTAEVIMLGASLYNQQIDLQQLYVKQHENQVTLNGQGALPSKSSDWLSPDFRGNISASINDLGAFARLFGAEAKDFAGKITMGGSMDARDRKIGGHLDAKGSSLLLFKTSIDDLSAKINLKGTNLEFEQLELRRGNDFLSGQGTIDMSHEHDYSGTLNATITNVAEYLTVLGGPPAGDAKPTVAEIQSTIQSGVWDTYGSIDIPDSKRVDFSAKFPLQIGKDWNSFQTSPINVTVDFPAINLAQAPRLFPRNVFREGTLGGKLTLTESLRYPLVKGEVQLTNGKLQSPPIDLTQTTANATFNGSRAAIGSLEARNNDIRISFRGEIDLRDANDIQISLTPGEPIFNLTPDSLSDVGQIEFVPAKETSKPALSGIDFRGGIFGNRWLVTLREPGEDRASGVTWEMGQTFWLWPRPGKEDRKLVLAVRPLEKPEKPRSSKRGKKR